MPIKPPSPSRCSCDMQPTARLPRESSQEGSEFTNRSVPAERIRRISDINRKYGTRFFRKRRLNRIKCPQCIAAGIAELNREGRADYRAIKSDTKRKETGSADDSGHEDGAVEVPKDTAFQTVRKAVHEKTSLQDLSNEEESEEDGFDDELYNSENTIRNVIYSDCNPNESYDEEESQEGFCPDSIDESFDHDDQRCPPPWSPEPSSQSPSCRSEAPSSASESQSSADADDEYDEYDDVDEERRKRERMREKEWRKEKEFRDKGDEKYLQSLSRRDGKEPRKSFFKG